MIKNITLLIIIIISSLVITGCTTSQITNNSTNSLNESNQEKKINIEKLEIIHFHGTNQCSSCIIVGDYANETINTFFKEELDQGIITFNHINGELQENRELVMKYGATGSSLWLGVYNDGEFKAEQNTNVWYKTNNKESYMTYLKSVIEQKLAGN